VSSGNPRGRESLPAPNPSTSGPATDAAPAAGSRLRLSRERIVEGALALLDRDGLDAFSMRRLADELGVGTMTIYGYFRSRDELLDAVVDSGREAIANPGSELHGEGSWKAGLRELMMGIRRSLVEHPAIVELRYKRPLLSPGALTVTEAGMRILRDAGFSDRDAGRVYRILFVYTFGFSAFGPGPGSEADRDKSLAALRALPPDHYPTLVGAAQEASESMADQTLYEVGLDALLDGLEPERIGPRPHRDGR
jgi:AcrR family transcriptional regulator